MWSRIRKARLVQVLLVYLGASWLILQVVNELTEALSLPAWLSPVAVILLLIGLLIILATAWVQSHPLAAQRAEREEVPRSWELDLGDAAKSLSAGRLPHLTWARSLIAGAAAFLLLFGVAGLYVVARDRGESFLPTPAVAEKPSDGIAVLPFSVRGAGLEEWPEGLVDLLSTGLDGAGGLRAIASGTVLARWRELVPETSSYPEEATALAVAERTGARYALLGSAVAIGPRVRLTAEIHSLDGGDRLGQVQAEAPPDSVLSLVDRLAVQTLALIAGGRGGELPPVDVAAVTTTSLPALRAYLEGEALFRRGDFTAAGNAFERAIREDSLFALAYYRLSQAFGWSENINSERGAQASDRALALIDRLPDRVALLVRASKATEEFRVESLQFAEEATRRYPDDAEAWFQLGEAQLHVAETLQGWPEAEASFQRAVRLAPQFAPYRIHLVEAAARFHADSLLLAQRVDELERLAPESWSARRYRLALSMAFGDSAARAKALAAVDSLPIGLEFRQLSFALGNPLNWEAKEQLLRRALRRAPPNIQPGIIGDLAFGLLFQRGHVDAALEELTHASAPPTLRLWIEQIATELELDVSTPNLDSALEAGRAGRVPPDGALAVGAAAAQRGKWEAHAATVARVRASADSLRASRDSTGASRALAVARAIEAIGIWRRGRPAEAARILEDVRTDLNVEAVRFWLGRIHRDLGNLQEAERYFRRFLTWDPDPMASYELGRIYQSLGDTDKARERLEFFIANWATADPGLQPLVEDAKRRLIELRAG